MCLQVFTPNTGGTQFHFDLFDLLVGVTIYLSGHNSLRVKEVATKSVKHFKKQPQGGALGYKHHWFMPSQA